MLFAVAGRKPTISDERLLREIALSPDPVVTTTEVADRVGMTQQAIYQRFQGFEEKGWLRSKLVGANARVWWLKDEGRQHLAAEMPDDG
jgi:predicted transcriptional regulator